MDMGSSDIDIEGHVLTEDGTIVVWWCLTWWESFHTCQCEHRCTNNDGAWVGSPSVATELRVTVNGRGRGAASWDVEVDVLSCDVPRDVYAKLHDYAVEEEQRQYEFARAS